MDLYIPILLDILNPRPGHSLHPDFPEHSKCCEQLRVCQLINPNTAGYCASRVHQEDTQPSALLTFARCYRSRQTNSHGLDSI